MVHAIGLTAFFASAASVGFISFLVTYSVEKGIDEGAAGVLLAVVSMCAATARIGLGAVADRGVQDALRPVPAMFLVSAGAYLLLIVGEPVLIVVAALLAGSFGWAWPGALNLAVVQHSPEAPAWAVGVMLAGCSPAPWPDRSRSAARRRRPLRGRLGPVRGLRAAGDRDRGGRTPGRVSFLTHASRRPRCPPDLAAARRPRVRARQRRGPGRRDRRPHHHVLLPRPGRGLLVLVTLLTFLQQALDRRKEERKATELRKRVGW